MRLLDLYCGAGGAAMGYHQAGFADITGVDSAPQKNYPFTFVQADALTYLAAHGHAYDVIHASPPCQGYSWATPAFAKDRTPKDIARVRAGLQALGRPYVIENVGGARFDLREPLMLCGTMFHRPFWRHRYFEQVPQPFALLPPCYHVYRPITLHSGSHTRASFAPVLVSGTPRRRWEPRRKDYSKEEKAMAIEIDWMTLDEMDQAVPPCYTRYLGVQLLRYLAQRGAWGCPQHGEG